METREALKMTTSTTKMSSRGQVVIPEEIRHRLGLTPGTQFVVIGDQDVIVLKSLAPPPMSDFDTLIAQARRSAEKAQMKQSDIEAAIESDGPVP